MTEIMIASMTDGQIETVVDQLRAAMRKHQNEVTKDGAQLALGTDNLGMRMFVPFRDLAEAQGEMIVRHVRVDRTKTPSQMVDTLGRKKYVDNDVRAMMPTQGKDEDDVYFFPAKRFIPAAELAAEYEKRGLIPDHYAQMQVSIDDPSFADEHPNGSQWQDEKGRYCYLAINRWDDERYVNVNQDDNDWRDNWWFAGVRKLAVPASE